MNLNLKQHFTYRYGQSPNEPRVPAGERIWKWRNITDQARRAFLLKNFGFYYTADATSVNRIPFLAIKDGEAYINRFSGIGITLSTRRLNMFERVGAASTGSGTVLVSSVAMISDLVIVENGWTIELEIDAVGSTDEYGEIFFSGIWI